MRKIWYVFDRLPEQIAEAVEMKQALQAYMDTEDPRRWPDMEDALITLRMRLEDHIGRLLKADPLSYPGNQGE
jgi:hypothetical protein